MSCKMTVFSALRQQSYWQRRWDSNPHALEHRSQIPACISNFITPLYFGASRGIRTLNPAGKGFSYHYIISAKISVILFVVWTFSLSCEISKFHLDTPCKVSTHGTCVYVPCSGLPTKGFPELAVSTA